MLNNHRYGGLPIEVAVHHIVLGPKFDAGHIAQAHNASILAGLHDNSLKFLRGHETSLRNNVHLESPFAIERRLANDPRRDLHVLISQRGDHFSRREILKRKPAWIEPDSHAVFARTVEIDISHAFEPLELLTHVQDRVVTDVELICTSHPAKPCGRP